MPSGADAMVPVEQTDDAGAVERTDEVDTGDEPTRRTAKQC